MRLPSRRLGALLLAGVSSSLLIWAPVRAASPPTVTVDSASLSFTEGASADMTGTWDEADGDEVWFSANTGVVDGESGRYHTWQWRPTKMDGPQDTVVTVTAHDADGEASVSFAVHVDNAPPYAQTWGDPFVPVNSSSDREFRWTAVDQIDSLDTVTDCGNGTVTGRGTTTTEGIFTMRCAFSAPGTSLVGVRTTDDDGGFTDGRIPVRATTSVMSVADGSLVIEGPDEDVQLGGSLATPDMNGDGKADIVIGGTATSNTALTDPGYVEVVFGRSAAGSIDLGGLPAAAGFRITGPPGVGFGRSISSAGDINGDGFDDLVIGAGDIPEGVVTVVFGSTSTDDVDAAALPAERGVQIVGTGVRVGRVIEGVGDVNGDGFDDVAIDTWTGFDETGVDVLFGRAAFTGVDLAALPSTRGVHIDGPEPGTGDMISGGDVNGDGLADVIIGTGTGWASDAVVVYGKRTMTNVDTSALTSGQGFRIGGGEGLSVSAVAAGDMDGDGYDDVAVFHSGWSFPSGWAASIIRGGAANASIPYLTQAPATRLIRIDGTDIGSRDMAMLDWNGDGRSDLLVGAPTAQTNGEASGTAFLLKGATTLKAFDLRIDDSRWVRIDGDNPYAFGGDAVAGGDVTGDGLADLLVGASGWTTLGVGHMRGRVGVFRGTKTDTTSPTVTAPTKSIATGLALVGSSPLIRIRWSGTDANSGIDHYQIQESRSGGAWVTLASTNSTSLDRALRTGYDYRFRVRAMDKAGNWSGWKTGTTMKLRGVQDTSTVIRYVGRWRTGTSPMYAAHKTRFATAAGARATLTFTGRQIAFAAPTGPTRGTALVYINGVFRSAVTLYSPSAQRTKVVAKWTWSSTATRTISIRVVGTAGHPRFDIDKFIIVR